MTVPDRAAIEAVPDDGVTAATVGTVLWAVAGFACVLMRDRLAEAGNEWWIATCLVGVVLGLMGIAFTRRRAQVYRGSSVAGPEPSTGPDDATL